MQVHIVTSDNIGRYYNQIEQMYRQRKSVFIDRLGWSDIDTGSQLELDDFDTEHAVYLLVMDDVGNLHASCRMTPTDKPNVTCDVLGHYFDDDPIRDPNTWEVSRWIPGQGDPAMSRITHQKLFLGMVEFSISRGVDTIISCANRAVLVALARSKIPLKKLSKPVRDKHGVATGISVVPDMELLGSLRRTYRDFKKVTVELSEPVTANVALEGLQLSLIDDIMSTTDRKLLRKLHFLSRQVIGNHLAESVDLISHGRNGSADVRFYQ